MAESNVSIDANRFYTRLARLHSQWKNAESEPSFKNLDALDFCYGRSSDDALELKTAALQLWLLGYEFPETVMVLTNDTLFFLSSQKKVSILEPLKARADAPIRLELLTRNNADNNAANYKQIMDHLKKGDESKKCSFGELIKETHVGPFADAWSQEIKRNNADVVDVTPLVTEVLAVKDEEELNNVRSAALFTAHLMKSLIASVEQAVDDERQVTHAALAKNMETMLENKEKRANIQKRLKFDIEEADLIYTPIIQSGGKYDLRANAESSSDPLHHGTIVLALGGKFKDYSANVARTLFIEPPKEQGVLYNFALELQQLAIRSLRAEQPLKSVYETCYTHVETHKREFLPHFTKNVGFGVGLEYPESNYLINAKNTRIIKPGMSFYVSVGFQDVPLKNATDPKAKQYSVLIGDTVIVRAGQEPEILTAGERLVDNKWKEISYSFEGDEPEKKEDKNKKKEEAESKRPKTTVVLDSRLREEKAGNTEETRKQHQKDLLAKKTEELRQRFMQDGDGSTADTGPKGKKFGDLKAYSDSSAFPKELKSNQILVDTRNEAIICPINGLPVPFHISTVKNVSKSDEGKFTYLRINFHTPGQSIGANIPISFPDVRGPNGMFIRELSYRSGESKNLSNAFRVMKELIKRVKTKDQEDKEKQDLVVQESLVLAKGKRPMLQDLSVRPNLSGKKTTGTLEAHQNGFRFTSNKGEKIDVIYRNIKHAFYQPADNELIVLIHFHLHNPILVGKKKSKDVQFYTEVGVQTDDLAQRRRAGYDPDEFMEEERERELRKKLNNEFKRFVDGAEQLSQQSGAKPLEFDIPYRELAFYGVPNKSNVLLQPTAYALANLIEYPFFVISLEDIELAHFERVQFQLRNFDIVLVFKDYTRPVARINAIPVKYLEPIKDWLDEVDIMYTEGARTLNWNKVMQTIRTDPEAFLAEGGWSFLRDESEDEAGGDAEMEEDSDSAFTPEGSEASEEEEDESGSEESLVEEESSEAPEEDDSGMDWDELEEEAKKADRARDYDEDMENTRDKKKQRTK
eukprot:GILK01004643.1.p1 GENE.GILK01004643.1~~GILK01004643.1.p1  ORF type:complete len:1051 (-),score=281.73 GILK01004643.1:164-3265(-)